MIFVFLLAMTSERALNYWRDKLFMEWAYENTSNQQESMLLFFDGLVASIFMTSIFCIIRSSVVQTSIWRGINSVHDPTLSRVLRAPINLFFDITPVGKIHKRFGSDLDHFHHVTHTTHGLMHCFYAGLASMIVTISTVPQIMLVMAAVGYKSYKVFKWVKAAQAKVWEMDDQVQTPVHRHLAESRKGNSLIRAFNKAG